MNTKKCIEITKVSKVKVEEKGKKIIFSNIKNNKFIKIKVDGCLVSNQLAADWVVSKEKIGDVIIELKGRGVEHGATQVVATASLLIKHRLRSGNLSALIVAARYPKFDTTVQKAKEQFAKRFSGPLHIVNSSNYEYYFEKVLRFDGPR